MDGTRPEYPKLYAPGEPYFDWVKEGAKELGLCPRVAKQLFDSTLQPNIPVPELLRKLAAAETEHEQVTILMEHDCA